MAYRIYLPPCYGENGRVYPTLYMLPGNDQTDAIWDELGLDETAEQAIKAKSIPPLLIVMPEGGWIARNSSGGPGSYESVTIDDLIPFIETTYCAWPEAAARAIGGLSRGGYWALEIAFRHPEQFSSVGGHSASLLDIAAGPDLNPQFTGLTRDLGSLRIYLDIGQNDGGIGNTKKLHEDLAAQNIEHTWLLNEGGHNQAYWSAHLEEYLAWYSAGWEFTNPSPACPPDNHNSIP
jgi:enterochelin esterase-like enzyme